MRNFSFNGITKPYITVLRGSNRPAWAPIEWEYVEVPNRPGAYPSQRKIKVRPLPIPVLLNADSLSDLQKIKEDLADWLIQDDAKPLVFDDEQDRTYYAVVDGSFDIEEFVKQGKGTIPFVCPDPYKYGPSEIANDLDLSSPIVLTNNGTVATRPIFRFTANQPSTYINIIKDDDYMAIGQPESTNQVSFQPYTSILYDQLQTTVGWGQANIVPDVGVKAGTMLSTGEEFYAEDYSTGNAYHGPALQKTFTPLSDYKIQVHFDVQMNSSLQRGRAEAYFIGEDGTLKGKIMVVCASSSRKASVLVDLRDGGVLNKHIVNRDEAYAGGFVGYVTLEKRGTTFSIEIGREKPDGSALISKENYIFEDLNGDYQKTLAGIVLHVAKWSDYDSPYRARFRAVRIYQVNQEEGIPYIVQPGDTVEINHQTENILINGESRTDLKDFGGNYFDLDPGENILVIDPPDMTAEIEWRTKYQ